MKRILAATLVGAAALTLAACSTPAEENSPTPTATASAPVTQVTLDVYAAASLTDVFTQLATEFEADNPA
jgi:molybdate transport system substrate-binding protein